MPEMAKTLRSQGVPEDMVYLAFAESEFSNRGKGGPWQFSKGTAERYGLRINRWIDERRDPILSTRAAGAYLSDLHAAAGRDWRVAIVGWNRGDLAIDRFWVFRGQNFEKLMDLLPGQTRLLLSRFMAMAFIAHNQSRYGIRTARADGPRSYEEVVVHGGSSFKQIAGSFHTTTGKLHDLNPAILHDRVPPYASAYKIRIPLTHTAMAN